MMHKGNALKSDRLSHVLRVVRAAGPFGATTLDIQLITGGVAIATDISELRANGYDIKCEYEGVNNFTGRRTFRYFYKGRKETHE